MALAKVWSNQLINAHEQIASYLEQHDDAYKELPESDKKAYAQERCLDKAGAVKAAITLAKAIKYGIKLNGLEIIIK